MPDRFGYRSRHYIVSLSSSRLSLPENQRFKNFKAEIQVRSALQHVWAQIEHGILSLPENQRFKNVKAEIQVRSALQHVWAQIEHGIGYKGEVSLPPPISRRFARLAALLEIGDELIKEAQSELEKYKEELPRRIERDPDAVPIDRLSLRIFLCGEKAGLELDKALTQVCATKLREEELSKNRIAKMVRALNHAGVLTVGDLRSTLDSLGYPLVNPVQDWQKAFGGQRFRNLARGFSIWLLGIITAAQKMPETEFGRLAELLELELTPEESAWLTKKGENNTRIHSSNQLTLIGLGLQFL